MKNVAEYISSRPDQQRELLFLLNDMLTAHNGMNAAIRYGIPFYGINRWICYLNPQKGNGVEVCFLQGKKLSEMHPLLDMKSRKMVAGIVLNQVEETTLEWLDKAIHDAIKLDSTYSK